LQPEQRQEEIPDVRFELLVAFCRRLVHLTVSHDALYLALRAAQQDAHATDDELRLLAKAVALERATGSPFPRGF
jgi:hypothetical protein